MARITETTVVVPAPPRTFTVEMSFAQLVALAEWSYTTERSYDGLYGAAPHDIQLAARENINRRIRDRSPSANGESPNVGRRRMAF